MPAILSLKILEGKFSTKLQNYVKMCLKINRFRSDISQIKGNEVTSGIGLKKFFKNNFPDRAARAKLTLFFGILPISHLDTINSLAYAMNHF